MARRGPILAVLLSTICSVGLADSGSGDSLYGRLGGGANVDAFVSAGIDLAAADARPPAPFAGADLRQIKQQLAARICALSGGGCRLTSLQFSESQFVLLVDVLRASMRTHAVPLAVRNELLEVLAPMRPSTP